MWNKTQLRAITGSLSTPSKMPGLSYGLSAAHCKIGNALANAGVAGPCQDCYAARANYQYLSVITAHARRLRALQHPDWPKAMAQQLQGTKWFRWHDSGDLQSVQHFAKIVEVAKLTPKTRHWLPTQEWGVVRTYVRNSSKLPKNLIVRFSARKYGDGPRGKVWKLWSSVTDPATWAILRNKRGPAYACPAHDNENRCGKCRECWNPRRKWIVYRKH